MTTHDTMVRILEIRELEKELQEACSDNCSKCKDRIKEKIDSLIATLGKDTINNPHLLRNYDLMIRLKELNALENIPFEQGRPSAIIADTIKGKGVSFIMNHHMARFNESQLRDALQELGE